jgi:cation-transporting P-type ATPase D
MGHNVLKEGGKNLNTENWMVYHPNGKHMFTCGEKKAIWYTSRNLAEKIGNFKIQLTFEPNGYGFDEDEEFGLTGRNVCCVVTGVNHHLQRHHIVPYCYRTHFPHIYKSKNHHDVVLINNVKHEEYESYATEFKDVIANMYGVKTIEELNQDYSKAIYESTKEKMILLSKFHTIFKGYGIVPRDVLIDCLVYISKNTGIEQNIVFNYNYIQLYKLFLLLRECFEQESFEFKENNRKLYDHGYLVTQQLDSEEKIAKFVKLWRLHFIKIMNPKYMPKGWSVDYRSKMKI